VTLSDGVLIRTVDAERYQQRLVGDAAVLDAYGRYFGIVLDRVPVRTAR